MASTINADNGVVSGSSGVKTTADTSGVLALQSNGTTGLTLGTDLVTTLAQPLPVGSGGTGATSLSGITVGTATSATTATNLAGGSNGTIPYQSASGTTQMLAAGTSGQVLTSNGAAAPTWATPAPGAGSADFVAYGSITAGQTVALRSDGKVERVFEVSQSASTGSETAAATSNNSDFLTSVYDPVNQKVICVYQNGAASNTVNAVVGTVSGTSITFGTPQVISSTSSSNYPAATYDTTNQKLVVAYNLGGSTDDGYAVVCSVSGTTITVGTPVLFSSGQAQYISACFDPVNAKVVIAYRDGADSDKGKAVVGTVSGTAISFGSIATFDNLTGVAWTACVYEPVSGKVVICYDRASGFAIAGTISGTNISFGTAYEFDTATLSYISAAALGSTGKVLVAYKNTNGFATVLSVSGSTITGGSPTQFNTTTGNTAVCYDPLAGVVNIYYQDSAASSQGVWVIGTVSGTSVSFNSESIFNGAVTTSITAVYDQSSYKQVAFWADGGLSGKLQAMVFANAVNYTNANSFIGLSTETVADGATATITINGGTNANQTGLTAGTSYWLNANGTLTTSNTGYPVAGIATSATSVLVGSNSVSPGAWVYISTTTITSSVSAVTITTGFSSAYDNYIILVENLSCVTATSGYIQLRMYKNGTQISSTTYNSQFLAGFNASPSANNLRNNSRGQVLYRDEPGPVFGTIQVFNANSTPCILANGASMATTGSTNTTQAGITNSAAGVLTGLYFDGPANFSSGTFKLYGVRK